MSLKIETERTAATTDEPKKTIPSVFNMFVRSNNHSLTRVGTTNSSKLNQILAKNVAPSYWNQQFPLSESRRGEGSMIGHKNGRSVWFRSIISIIVLLALLLFAAYLFYMAHLEKQPLYNTTACSPNCTTFFNCCFLGQISDRVVSSKKSLLVVKCWTEVSQVLLTCRISVDIRYDLVMKHNNERDISCHFRVDKLEITSMLTDTEEGKCVFISLVAIEMLIKHVECNGLTKHLNVLRALSVLEIIKELPEDVCLSTIEQFVPSTCRLYTGNG